MCKVFFTNSSVFIHVKIRTNYHTKNFTLRLTLKKRLRGLNGLISTDKLQKQDATKNVPEEH